MSNSTLYGLLKREVLDINRLNKLNHSDFLVEYFTAYVNFFFFSNLISIFFATLKSDIVTDLNLRRGTIQRIRLDCSGVIQKINVAIRTPTMDRLQEINLEYYERFRQDKENSYPSLEKLFNLLEKQNRYQQALSYLSVEEDLFKFKRDDNDLSRLYRTLQLETSLRKGKWNMSKKEELAFGKSFLSIIQQGVPNIVQTMFETSKSAVDALNKSEIDFTSKLYQEWEQPLDKLKILINRSLEVGEDKLSYYRRKFKNRKIPTKESVLIQLNARAIQVANETFVLLKNGFTDGANARWRTLFELTVIFIVIANNPDEFAKRFLEYQSVRKYKQSLLLKDYHAKLGMSFSASNHTKLHAEYTNLQTIFGKDCIQKDYSWIPQNFLKDCNFKGLVKKIDLDHFLPFYDESHNQVHGGSKGLYRIGLTKKH